MDSSRTRTICSNQPLPPSNPSDHPPHVHTHEIFTFAHCHPSLVRDNVAGLIPSSASAQWTVIDPANLAQAITQVTKLVEQIDLIKEQIDLQETIRKAADDHLSDFRKSLGV